MLVVDKPGKILLLIENFSHCADMNLKIPLTSREFNLAIRFSNIVQTAIFPITRKGISHLVRYLSLSDKDSLFFLHTSKSVKWFAAEHKLNNESSIVICRYDSLVTTLRETGRGMAIGHNDYPQLYTIASQQLSNKTASTLLEEWESELNFSASISPD